MTLNESKKIINGFIGTLSKKQREAINSILNIAENTSEKDPYGIKNVNFSICKKEDKNWELWKKQRLTQGFDSTECWNLDTTICKFIYPRLVYFKNHTTGYPLSLTEESWNKILDKMILFFSRRINGEFFPNYSEEELEGKKLFMEYFEYLWW